MFVQPYETASETPLGDVDRRMTTTLTLHPYDTSHGLNEEHMYVCIASCYMYKGVLIDSIVKWLKTFVFLRKHNIDAHTLHIISQALQHMQWKLNPRFEVVFIEITIWAEDFAEIFWSSVPSLQQRHQ